MFQTGIILFIIGSLLALLCGRKSNILPVVSVFASFAGIILLLSSIVTKMWQVMP
jgi:hypothetical protein